MKTYKRIALAVSLALASTAAMAIPAKVATGLQHSLYINGSTLMGMGSSWNGALGDQVPRAFTNALPQPLGIEDAAAVAANAYTSGYITTSGDLFVFGYFMSRDTIVKTPEKVASSGIVTDFALGYSIVVFIVDGRVYQWDMQVGSSPIDMGLSNIAVVSTGDGFSVARSKTGDVYTWGHGTSGELGTGELAASLVTPEVIATGVSSIAAGPNAVSTTGSDGSGTAWGDNTHDKLGTASVDAAVALPTTITSNVVFRVTTIGKSASFGIELTTGDLYAWGWHNYIDYSDNVPYNQSSVPTRITDLTDVREVSAFGDTYLVLLNNGDLYGWGGDGSGKLGNDAEVRETHEPEFIAQLVIIAPEVVAIDPPLMCTAEPIYVAGPIEYVEITVAGPTQYVDVPGPTQYVDVPGPTQYVDVPGPTQYVDVPGPIEYVEISLGAMDIKALKSLRKQIKEQIKTLRGNKRKHSKKSHKRDDHGKKSHKRKHSKKSHKRDDHDDSIDESNPRKGKRD